MPFNYLIARSTLIAAACLTAACGPHQDTLEDVKSGLNSILGGYSHDQELPRFGRDDLDLARVKPAFALPEVPTFGFQVPAPEQPHSSGVMVGAWIDMERGTGVWTGKWADQGGQIIGHMKGIYGYSETYHQQVFFAKLIDVSGNPKGVINGRFDQGRFRGSWVDEKETIRGILAGCATPNRTFRAKWHALPKTENENTHLDPWRFVN